MRRIRCRSRRVNPPARIPSPALAGEGVGELLVEVGDFGQTPRAWETLRYRCDRPHRIRNLSSVPAHATMVCIRRPRRWSNAFVAPASKGGGMRAASHAFLQAFPNLGCFCPSFSKQFFGRFVGFQGVASLKNLNDVSPNFLRLRPPSSRIAAAPTLHSAAPAPHVFERVQRFA
jgi:hypothetical protein